MSVVVWKLQKYINWPHNFHAISNWPLFRVIAVMLWTISDQDPNSLEIILTNFGLFIAPIGRTILSPIELSYLMDDQCVKYKSDIHEQLRHKLDKGLQLESD